MHREWQLGMTVSGVLDVDGQRVTITIHPNGTADEVKSLTGRNGGFRRISKTDVRTLLFLFCLLVCLFVCLIGTAWGP